MLKIESRRWVAVWYRCPKCGSETGETMMTPWRWAHRRVWECHSIKHERCVYEVVEHRWYTTFCIESGLSFDTIAGTLEMIGPFRVCNIVHHDIRAFKRWYRRRKAEEAEKTRLYLERERQVEEAYRARLASQRQEAALSKKAGGEAGFDPFLDDEF